MEKDTQKKVGPWRGRVHTTSSGEGTGCIKRSAQVAKHLQSLARHDVQMPKAEPTRKVQVASGRKPRTLRQAKEKEKPH